MMGIARAPGTCGELVQGKTEGTNFLVTCPVDIYSVVTVKLNNSGKVTDTNNLPKVRLAVEKTLALAGCSELGAEVSVSSKIPHGKGMASSTADISAACAAVSQALEIDISEWDIAGIALSIEPTDGLMFPGITVFDHIEGKIARVLGPAPAIEAVILDLGGTIDTVGFNASIDLDIQNRLKEHKITVAMEKIESGLTTGNMELIGQAATLSAFANQHILYKEELDEIYSLCKRAGGLGVNIAHSGTVIGLLFESPDASVLGSALADRAVFLLKEAGFNKMYRAKIINGGVDVLEERAGDKVWRPLNEYTVETYGKRQKNTG